MKRRKPLPQEHPVLDQVVTLAEAARLYNYDAMTISYWLDLGHIIGRRTGGNVLIYRPSIDQHISGKNQYIPR